MDCMYKHTCDEYNNLTKCLWRELTSTIITHCNSGCKEHCKRPIGRICWHWTPCHKLTRKLPKHVLEYFKEK